MENLFTPCRNTAKMLGANARNALDFGDACFVLANNINPKLKSNARERILSTVLLGKHFEFWMEELYKSAKLASDKYTPMNSLGIMPLEKAKTDFSFVFVKEVLSILITKQYLGNE